MDTLENDAVVRLEILGPPRLVVRGNEVVPSHRKSMALAGWLALQGGSVTRDRVVSLLWPSLEPSKARRALRTALSALNGAASFQVFESTREIISLNSSITADIDEFRRRAEVLEAEEPLSGEYHEKLEAVIGLYRGNLLEGLNLSDVDHEYDDFITQEEMALTETVVSLHARAVRSATLRGSVSDAIEHARIWSRLDPTDQRPHRRLMELYSWTGRKDLAIQQFERLAADLRRELGSDPDEETIELRDLISENRLADPPFLSEKKHTAPVWEGRDIQAGTTTVLAASLERTALRLLSFDAYDAASVVNLYLQDELTAILRRRSAGNVTVFGDRIGALFGFPSAGGDAAHNAVMAGIEMVQAARGWNFMLTVGVGTDLVYRRLIDDSADSSLTCGPGIRAAEIQRFGGDAGGVYLDESTAKLVNTSLPLQPVRMASTDGTPVAAWRVKTSQ